MSDVTRRDVQVGDISAINAHDSTATSPRVGGGTAVPPGPAPAPTGTGGGKQSAGAPPAGRAPGIDWRVLLLIVFLVVLAAALVFGVFHLYREQVRLAEALAAVEAQQQSSMQVLETQVTSTATTLESTLKSSDSETQKSLNLLAADIGRLNDALAKRGQQVDAQGRDLARRGEEIAALGDELKRLGQASTQATAQLDTRLKSLADSLEQQSARQKGLADTLTRLERSGDAAQLRSELAVLSASLREGQQEHERRLKGTEQAIASNDAFRRQVNATIDRLTQQVSELYQKR